MKKFSKVKSLGAYLPIDNIDTDMIISKEYMKTINKEGLGKALFAEMRYLDGVSVVNSDFILNKDDFKESKILLAGDNFGCGSSREHAPWALADFGIAVVISTGFADIFYNNCFQNGILPIKLAKKELDLLVEKAVLKEDISVLLEEQIVSCGDLSFSFEVGKLHKSLLLNGWDSIDMTLNEKDTIDRFEEKQRKEQPWLW